MGSFHFLSPCSNFTPQTKTFLHIWVAFPRPSVQHSEKPNPCESVLCLNLKMVGLWLQLQGFPWGLHFTIRG